MNTVNQDQKAEGQSQVQEYMGKLNNSCEELLAQIDTLEKRLGDVLRNEPPNAPDEKVPTLVPLAQHLDERCSNVKYAIQRIYNILGRLEL